MNQHRFQHDVKQNQLPCGSRNFPALFSRGWHGLQRSKRALIGY